MIHDPPPPKKVVRPGELAPLVGYFAGGLFNHKELIGNVLLAEAITRVSQGRYVFRLPQDLEQVADRACSVRDNDLAEVVKSDFILVNFDGAELDSGTVIEDMFADFLDIPGVLLRTDFRAGGDGFKDGDQWNLMASFWPRSEVLNLNSMAIYQESFRAGGTTFEKIDRYYTTLAAAIIEKLDKVVLMTPVAQQLTADELKAVYKWMTICTGGNFSTVVSQAAAQRLLAIKKRNGLL